MAISLFLCLRLLVKPQKKRNIQNEQKSGTEFYLLSSSIMRIFAVCLV